MEPWETPALTWYSCEAFPSRTTWSNRFTEKSVTKGQIPKLKFHNKTVILLCYKPVRNCHELAKKLTAAAKKLHKNTSSNNFFICFLVVTQPTFSRYNFLPQGHHEPHHKVGFLCANERAVGFVSRMSIARSQPNCLKYN